MNKLILMNKIRKSIRNYPSCILDYYLYFSNLKKKREKQSTTMTQYTLRNGLRFTTRRYSGDVYALCEAAATNVYRLEKLKPGSVVVDIGAHIGTFSILASTKAAHVYALEPMKDNFEMLQKNISLNNRNNITAINKAIAPKQGSITLHYTNNKLAASVYERYAKTKTITLDALSIPSLMRRYKLQKIDFLKIDCEGAEYDILFSLTKSQLAAIERIHMETHTISDTKNLKTMMQFLSERGFEPTTHQGMIYAHRHSNI